MTDLAQRLAQPSAWGSVTTATLSPAQQQQSIGLMVERLKTLPPATLRDPVQVAAQARTALAQMAGVLGIAQHESLVPEIVAQLTGLGFLYALLPPQCQQYSEIIVNPDGGVWVLAKGRHEFERLNLAPTPDEVWRAVEALLARVGRAVSEATPSVDAKLPRAEGFGGARVKVLHPAVTTSQRYPALNIRLFEPRPVTTEQLCAWQAAPAEVIELLLKTVQAEARLLVIGGTNTGKTTWLSALANSIPAAARIVKIEDPEEIYLSAPNLTTLEARPAPPGASVAPYTIRDGVNDAMRMSPRWLIVGEVRTGDAALALFRAQMSDHPGMSTFHAESPTQAVTRMALVMFADAGVAPEAARAIFAQAVDVVLQVGWREGRRALLGVWQVVGLKNDEVVFAPLWTPDMPTPQTFTERK
jgi:pilus assembly protein CpaF